MSTITYRPTRYEQVMHAVEGMNIRARRKVDSYCVYVDEKMFACLLGDDVGLKLPPEDAAKIIGKFSAEYFKSSPTSQPMKDYIRIPKEVLDDTDAFIELVKISTSYVTSV